jgi:type IV pilus assembly protein PilC
MLFSSRLPLAVLSELCRSLRHTLNAGLPLPDVFRQQAENGPAPLRPIAERVSSRLAAGNSLGDALHDEAAAFPPLFLSLTEVGEQTGMLPEVFHELERYFERQQRLWKQFVGLIAWPVFQFVAAIFVLAGLIFFLGVLPTAPLPNGQRWDPLGLGLSGPSGAAWFLGGVAVIFLLLWGVWQLLARSGRQSAGWDRYLLGTPALGPCLRSLALARFCLALRLTTETGMPIGRAVRLSLRATGNNAFSAVQGEVKQALQAGDDLTRTLSQTGLFPAEFQRILAVAEESGRLSEVLQQQGEYHHEEASRRLAFLTGLAGYGIWAAIGVLIIVVIFRLFGAYLSLLDSFSL